MLDLVTPPWNLCGFDPDYDPYAMPVVVGWYRCLFPPGSERMEVERVRVDQNARDGEWRELAFMPQVPEAVRLVDDGPEYWVPHYYTPAELLSMEKARARA